MVLTHAHNDHSGRILQLISEGFKGYIYCTDATKKIIFEMYDDGWNYQDVKKKYFWSKSKKEKIQLHESKEPLTLHWHSACKSAVKNIEESKSPVSVTQLKNKYGISKINGNQAWDDIFRVPIFIKINEFAAQDAYRYGGHGSSMTPKTLEEDMMNQ